MAQALTGHGCFQGYLWRRKRAANPGSVHCPAVFDDAEHTVFFCPFWEATRVDVSTALRKSVRPEYNTHTTRNIYSFGLGKKIISSIKLQ